MSGNQSHCLKTVNALSLAASLFLFGPLGPNSGGFALASRSASHSSALQNPALSPAPANTIPFELASGFLIVTECRVGNLSGLRCVLDTGTTRTMLDTKLAEKLGLQSRQTAVWNLDHRVTISRADAPDLLLGPLHVSQPSVLVGSLSELSEFAGSIDVLIGLDILRMTQSLRIDFHDKLLTFQNTGAFAAYDPARAQALTVGLTVQGQPVWLVLDTGASDLLLFEDRLHKHQPPLAVATKVRRAHVGTIKGKIAAISGVRLGTAVAEFPAFLIERGPSAMASNIDGYLGIAALHPRFVELDFAANRLRFLEAATLSTSLPASSPAKQPVFLPHHVVF
jgi:hypothetical protein